MSLRHATSAVCGLVGSSVFASSAQAHSGAAGGFFTGLQHPVSGLDHVAAMVAVGLWGAQLGRPALWLLPVFFPLVMAVGAFVALVGGGLPGVEIGIAVSGIVLGSMVLLKLEPPLSVAVVLVSVFAIFHGHAHGAELPADQNGLVYSAGFVLSTGILHASGIAIGLMHTWRTGAILVRALGGLIVLGGGYFLWQAFI